MKPLDRIHAEARARARHIILPEGGDPRVAEAARIATARGLARITLMDGPAIPGVTALSAAEAPDLPALADHWHRMRAARGMTAERALAEMRDGVRQAAMRVHLGQADGHRYPWQDADGRVERRHLLQAFAQALANVATFLGVDAGQQDHELFAAVAGHAVLGTQLVAQGVCHQAQGIVAGQVTVLVVVGFEVVDIQHQQGQLLATACGPRPFVGEDFIEVAAVTQASQCVGA